MSQRDHKSQRYGSDEGSQRDGSDEGSHNVFYTETTKLSLIITKYSLLSRALEYD